MWGLGFWTRLQHRQEAFESKHILLSFLCCFFCLSRSHKRTFVLWHSPEKQTSVSHPRHFLLTSFLQKKKGPRAKEIRWGHGCFAGLQIVCRKVKFVSN